MLPFTQADPDRQRRGQGLRGTAGRPGDPEVGRHRGQRWTTCARACARPSTTCSPFPAAQVDGSEAREISVRAQRRPFKFDGEALPEALGAAELLLPRHDDLCAAAPRVEVGKAWRGSASLGKRADSAYLATSSCCCGSGRRPGPRARTGSRARAGPRWSRSRGSRGSARCPCGAVQRLTVTSSPRRATTIWPFLASRGLLHREQVAVHDAGVAHAHAAHLQQVVGPAREHAGLDR
jgi:hypothetical protein